MRKKDARHMESLSGDKTPPGGPSTADRSAGRVLEIVLKCDSYGSTEAVVSALKKIQSPEVEVRIISAGIGTIAKSDLLMALSGSKLVLGFDVDIMPRLESWLKDHGVEVRLYDVIYKLVEDVHGIVQSMLPRKIEEKITGKARVIALFKTHRHGIILGCEVTEGVFAVGSDFRLITAMGPVYSGRVGSLQIERRPVKEGRKGQEVGLKLDDFDGAKVGDLVECYQRGGEKDGQPYKASGKVLSFKQ